MALIKCSECETEMSDKAKFCPKCGAENKIMFCPECGKQLSNKAVMCSGCGYAFGNTMAQKNNKGNMYGLSVGTFVGVVGWSILAVIELIEEGWVSYFIEWWIFLFPWFNLMGIIVMNANQSKKNIAKSLGIATVTISSIFIVIWLLMVIGLRIF